MSQRHVIPVAATLVLLASMPALAQPGPTPAGAPTATGPVRVASANPFGLLLELFNTEYERRVGNTVTVGVGGSTATVETYDSWGSAPRDRRYINGDLFVRYYPGGRTFEGRSFGVKAGLTQIPGERARFGIGFDANRSWLLNDHFYFGSGFGLKRLFDTDSQTFPVRYIPTLRLNVGVAF